MEREPSTPPTKLMEVAARDFPRATEILVSFPDQWEHIETIQSPDSQLYIAGFPLERAHTSRNHFEGLSPEINVSLVFYRLYKFFQPWPMPTIIVDWDARMGRGQVMGMGDLKLQLHPVGQAQAWFGLAHAVLWECYIEQSRRRAEWQETLARIWQLVERDTGAPKIFTLPHAPAFEGSYTDYLRKMSYEVDAENFGWWSKSIQQSRVSVTAPVE